MSRIVIVAYRPRPGREQELRALVARHMPLLAELGLVTDRPAWAMRASDGAIVEVFEWRSAEAIERAHSDAAVQALWNQFAAVCEYTPLMELAEARQPFAEFEPLDS